MERTLTGDVAVRIPAQRQVDSLDLDIVIPVYNEEVDLPDCVARLVDHLATLPLTARITIADNASTDGTWAIAEEMTARYPQVQAIRLDAKGRGRALRNAWTSSDATVVAYMDVDLSTDLDALFPLVAPLLSGHSDVAIGTRLGRGSRVVRGAKREFISRSYNVLLRTALRVRFSDAQCGFKAIRSDRATDLLPLVEDDGWFFDTELLTLAERAGMRIHEVPVDWVDDPDSRVDIWSTAMGDLRGIVRLMRGFTSGRLSVDHLTRRQALPEPERTLLGNLVRFALVGVASTALFGVLFLLFRMALPAQVANVNALLVATFANTAVNRRFTFGVRGRSGRWRQQAQGYVVLGIALVITSGSLALLHAFVPEPGAGVELAVLTIANLIATLVRFLLFRAWIFTRTKEMS
ncbi:MAG: bifunctional glycosyltransferase family 2/GtrA family protein [Candidatus Nanopelagicales bacterium]